MCHGTSVRRKWTPTKSHLAVSMAKPGVVEHRMLGTQNRRDGLPRVRRATRRSGGQTEFNRALGPDGNGVVVMKRMPGFRPAEGIWSA